MSTQNGPIGPDHVWVEVSDDTYTEAVQRQFRRFGTAVAVRTVDLGDGPREVRATTRGEHGGFVLGQAYACAIEESGSGIAWLVYGGNAGVCVLPRDASSSALLTEADERWMFDAFFIVDRDDLGLV